MSTFINNVKDFLPQSKEESLLQLATLTSLIGVMSELEAAKQVFDYLEANNQVTNSNNSGMFKTAEEATEEETSLVNAYQK